MKTKKATKKKITVQSVRREWQDAYNKKNEYVKVLEGQLRAKDDDMELLSREVARKDNSLKQIRHDLSGLLRPDGFPDIRVFRDQFDPYGNTRTETALTFPEIFARIGMLLEVKNRTNYETFMENVHDRLGAVENIIRERKEG